MNSRQHIIDQQVQWAAKRGIKLIGSQGERGEKTYTPTVEENLFEPLDPIVRQMFLNADGDELSQPNGWPTKMQALHSSSALAVNLFHYFWKRPDKAKYLAQALGFCQDEDLQNFRIAFEQKFPILPDLIIKGKPATPPNIDVVIHASTSAGERLCAIECKFTEPFRKDCSTAKQRQYYGIAKRYLDHDELWEGLPNLRKLAESLCPEDGMFKHLHAAQLVKHILGLMRHCKAKNAFHLTYLFSDIPHSAAKAHGEEIRNLQLVAAQDGILLSSISVQDLILRLVQGQKHQQFLIVDWLMQRYGMRAD